MLQWNSFEGFNKNIEGFKVTLVNHSESLKDYINQLWTLSLTLNNLQLLIDKTNVKVATKNGNIPNLQLNIVFMQL